MKPVTARACQLERRTVAGGGAAVVRPRLQNRMSYWRWCFPTRDEVWGVGGNVLAICGVQDRRIVMTFKLRRDFQFLS